MNCVQLIFSPTGGTMRAAKAITDPWGPGVEIIDLTDPALADRAFQKEDLVLIAVPSFGGRVPELAAQRLTKILKLQLLLYCSSAVKSIFTAGFFCAILLVYTRGIDHANQHKMFGCRSLPAVFTRIRRNAAGDQRSRGQRMDAHQIVQTPRIDSFVDLIKRDLLR